VLSVIDLPRLMERIAANDQPAGEPAAAGCDVAMERNPGEQADLLWLVALR
jgi:hypothetical protein